MTYERKLKNDWSARWIWDDKERYSKNVWLCFNKTVSIDVVPKNLTACISAEHKYILYINGETVVREGGLKRGPTPAGCYFDEVDVAPYLKKGDNLISLRVWYWGGEVSFSSTDCGTGGLLMEAVCDGVSIVTDKTWKVMKDPAFKEDTGELQPNFRLPERNVFFDARDEMIGWNTPEFDFSGWDNATEYDLGGSGVWGETYKREVPMWKDYGLKEYVYSVRDERGITSHVPYNAQLTPYLRVNAASGKTISITTENTASGAVHSTYVTRDGVQEFESPAWFNGERITYSVPEGVEVLDLKYRESGYATEFCGDFSCGDSDLCTLWQKSLRTLYVTMRDNFMDCPDRERAQWWADVTNEMMMSMYSLDSASYLLYRKGVSTMLSFIDPATKVLQTVVPIKNFFFELPMQQLAGICGFLTYYKYTGEKDLLEQVLSFSIDYLDLWEIGDDGLAVHRAGSWDWPDWGERFDVPVLENAWYCMALSSVAEMANIIGDTDTALRLEEKRAGINASYQKLWCGEGYKSASSENYDDRGNAVAILAGLCPDEHYCAVKDILYGIRNSSPYMEFYVLEALCRMGEFDLARKRMCERYREMTEFDYSTLWELWSTGEGTMNHAWSGGPLVIMSKYFAGVSPLLPGYESVRIAPVYELYDEMSCTVPTVRGEIRMSYVTENGHTTVNLDIPKGVSAEVHLPVNDSSVYLSGEKISDTKKHILYVGKRI